MPVEPVPITPTRSPVKSTGSWGQALVWNQRPLKLSMPGMSGRRALDRLPVAMMQKRAPSSRPVSVRTVHWLRPGSNRACVTRVPRSMSRRSSNRSATWLM